MDTPELAVKAAETAITADADQIAARAAFYERDL